MRKMLFVLSVGLFMGILFAVPRTLYAASGNGEFVVQTIPGPTVAEKLAGRAGQSWPWYLTRASGIIAAFTLVVLMLSGIGQVTGYTFKFLDPITSWASHRALGIAFCVSVFLHVFSLLFDHFVKFNLLELLIPWLSKYKPTTIFGFRFGSLFVALGVLSFYLAIIITLSSLVWVEKKPFVWKILHLLSYVTIFFVFIHALYIGTDLTHGVFKWIWISFGVGIFIASMQRLWRAKTS